MEGTMKTAVMLGIGKMGFKERKIPQVKEDEVLVRLEYVGICGSDLHYYESGAIGDYVVKPPFVLGHEPGGTVVEVGKNVKHLKAGDRVALEPGKTCGHCEFCKTGRYNLCPDVVFFATPPVDGVFQEYVAHEAQLCFKLPDNVSTMEGALIEPLAVGFHAAMQGGARAGQTAVVMGAGCIGLVTMMALKAMGVSKVYAVDIMEKRLQKALELGATDVVIVGGLGGARLDHTLANLQTLVFLAKNGVCATLADTDNEVTALLPGTHRIQARPGWYFSIFSAGEQALGVTLEGLKYPLHDYTLTHAFPIGVSNEFAAETATLRFSAGMIYLVLSRKEPPRG